MLTAVMIMTQFSFIQIYPEKNDIPTLLPFVVAASISQTFETVPAQKM